MGEASTLSNMGRVYNNLGDKQKALDYLIEAPALSGSESSGSTTQRPGQHARQHRPRLLRHGRRQAGARLLQSRAAALERGRRAGGEALMLNDMGPAYAAIGQKQKALEAL